MGSVFKKQFTKPLPAGAERFTRKGIEHAKWRGKDGQWRTGRVAGEGRVAIEAETFTGKYRDGAGIVREVSTGCRIIGCDHT